MSYATEHAGALGDVRAAGRALSFLLTTPGTQDAATEQFAQPPSTRTVSGYAIRKKGDPRRYEALKLTENNSLTLLFVPSVYGEEPPLNSVTVWLGKSYTVKSVNPTAPDGVLLLAEVIVSS